MLSAVSPDLTGFSRLWAQGKALSAYCTRFPQLPSYFWLPGTLGFALLGGYNGTVTQELAGLFDCASQWVVATTTTIRHRYPIATAFNTATITAWQWPFLMDGSMEAWTGYLIKLIGNLPVMLEPWLQPHALRYLEEHRPHSATKTYWDRLRHWPVRVLAHAFDNTAPFWTLCQITAMAPWMLYVVKQKPPNYQWMLPVFALWITGDLLRALTRPRRKPYGLRALPMELQ